MPQLSTRITGLNDGGSDGWDVFYRARALVAAGRDITELTIGEHDRRTDPAILQDMHASAVGGHTGYAAVPGTDGLRDAVAARVAERTGVATTRDNVLITPGGQAALFAAHMTALDGGQTGLYIDPCYATYPGTIRAAGGRAVAVATMPDTGFLPHPRALAGPARGARSLLVNTPNNPAGRVYPRHTLDGIAAVAEAHDLWVISDEVYDTQVWDGAHLSPRALPRMAARTLVAGSLSKSHAMTGSRIGWLVGPEDAIARAAELATVTTYGVPGFIQDAAQAAIARGTEPETDVAAPFRRRCDLLMRVVAAEGGEAVRALPAEGTMYVLLDIRATGMTGAAFADALLDAEGIAVMPGESFGQAAAGHVRVALTVDDARLERALRTLARFARARVPA
jgi:arginine:pyruvate transaminase